MLVLTIISADRPGIVEIISRVVADHGGNWLESRMSRLGGQFAGIVRIEAPPHAEADLLRDLGALSSQGLTVVCRGAGDEPPASRMFARLELTGLDRPGIVRDISQALAKSGANVEELETSCESAPMSGEPLFKASITIGLPADGSLAAVRADLEEIATHLMVDISLAPVEAAIA